MNSLDFSENSTVYTGSSTGGLASTCSRSALVWFQCAKFLTWGSVIGVDPEAWIQIVSLLDQDIVDAHVPSQDNEVMKWHLRFCLCSLKVPRGGPLSDVSSTPLYHPALKTSPPCSISCNLPALNACPSCYETTHNTDHPSPVSLCAP